VLFYVLFLCVYWQKPEETRPLRRPRHRGQDDDIMHLKSIGLSVKDWNHLAHDRDKQCGNESLDSIKGGTS
jgi:hypothetical protein